MAYVEDLLAKLQQVLKGQAPGVPVYDYEPVVMGSEEFLATFGTGATDSQGYPIAQGWTIAIENRLTQPTATRGQDLDTYAARLRVYWSVHDGGQTQRAFTAHVIAVADYLTRQASLQGFAGVMTAGPCQVEDLGHRRFGQQLAHYASLAYPVRVHVSRGRQ